MLVAIVVVVVVVVVAVVAVALVVVVVAVVVVGRGARSPITRFRLTKHMKTNTKSDI